jgi:hypothetical protein
MSFNVFAFVGHGIIDDKDRALFLVNTKEKGSKNQTVETINVDELAHEFAAIPNTVSLFLFIACRNKLKASDKSKSYPDPQDLSIDEVNEKF